MNRTPKTVVLSLACLVALLCGGPGLSAELYGRVVGVSDGDTITVLDAEQVTHKVRLSGIDAPEKAQPFGERAKRQLSDWVYPNLASDHPVRKRQNRATLRIV